MSRSWLAVLFLLAALPAAAQQQQGGATWQQGGANTWQQVPGSQRQPPGLTPLPQANGLAPELSDNYQRMLQQRRLNERMESGSALILQGAIPRDR
jgi:hypothetical protein